MKIAFFTTSIFTDIQDTQSSCIKTFFPDCKHYIIDGRRNWFSVWYDWIDLANKSDADWFIHIDEDCFITSTESILKQIKFMEENNYDIAGCPDGYHDYREANPIALNSFFMILNRKALNAWIERKEIPQFNTDWIEEYPFEKRNNAAFITSQEFGSSGKPLSQIWVPGTEPYYDFMWVLKAAGIKFNYLEPLFGKEFQTTNLLDNTVIHMWYLRDRNINGGVCSLHTMYNSVRFDGIKNKIQNLINQNGIKN